MSAAVSGATAVGSQRTRPAQQVLADTGEQEAVGADPAGGFEHGERAMNEVGRGGGLGQGGQRGAQGCGLRAEAAHPELAALVGRRWRQRGGESIRLEQPRDEEQRDRRDAGAQVGQGELGQQGNGALTDFTQVAAHADGVVEGGVDERAGVEAVRDERIFGLALRTVGGAMLIEVGELIEVLLHRAGEWM